MEKQFHNAVLNYLYSQVWALREDVVAQVELVVMQKYFSNATQEERKEMAALGRAAKTNTTANMSGVNNVSGKNVQVVPIYGVIEKRMNMIDDISSTGTSTQKLKNDVQEAINSSDIHAIVLDVDSPGGNSSGIQEISQIIYEARGVKPILAFTNGSMDSAAIWIGSSAVKIIASESADIGSIGAWMMHSDHTEMFRQLGIKNTIIRSATFKAAANPYEAITEDARQYLQEMVSETKDIFVADLARNYGIDKSQVEGWATGKVYLGKAAKEMGLIHEIGTFDETVAMAADMAGGKTSVAVHATHINSHNNDSVNINSNKEDDMDLKALEEKMGKLAARVDVLEDDNKTLKASNDTLVEANKKLTASNEELTKANGKLSLKMTLTEEKDRKAKEQYLADYIMSGILADSNVPVKAHGQVKKLYGDYSKHVEDNGTFTAGSESEKAFVEAFKSEVASIEADFSSDSSIGASDPKDDQGNSTESDVSLAQELARSISGKIRSDG